MEQRIEIRILGTVSVRRHTSDGWVRIPLRGREPPALLALLAGSPDEVTRDEVLRRLRAGLTYDAHTGDQPTYEWTRDLRAMLGDDAKNLIETNRRRTLRLAREPNIWVDYDDFRQCRLDGRHEDALALVRGEFAENITHVDLNDLRARILEEINDSRASIGLSPVVSARNAMDPLHAAVKAPRPPIRVRTAMSPRDYRDWIVAAEREGRTIDRIPKRISVVFKDPMTVEQIALQRFGAGSGNVEHYVAEHTERREQFFNALQRGMRCREIYNMQELLKYVTSKKHASATLTGDSMAETVRRWREAIVGQANYFVGLTEDPLPFKYEIVDDDLVILHEAIGVGARQRLNAIFIEGVDATSGFVDDFDVIWDNIPPELRKSECVTTWIDEKLIPLSEP